MSIGAAVAGQLQATDAVTRIIANRLYPENVRIADKVYPLCVYHVENDSSLMANDGPTGLKSANIIIAALDVTYRGAGMVADVIEDALDGARGVWSGVTIQGCFLEDDGARDDVVTDSSTQEILYYSKELTFLVWYT